MKNSFIPLLSIGYSIAQLRGIDSKQLSKDVMKNKHLRLDDDPNQTGYEDTSLPDTVESRKLLSMIEYEVRKINPYLKILDTSGKGVWGHILEPGQSTMYHEHDLTDIQRTRGHIDGISFAYYVTYPENSGDLVFCVETLKRRIMLPVRPSVGNLVLFPTYVPHLTLRNLSKENRISISGNFFPDPERMKDFYKEIYEGRSNYFYYVGTYNDY
jgi:hypothetical protein